MRCPNIRLGSALAVFFLCTVLGAEPDTHLVNLSARARVGTAADVVIAGFVVAESELVLVRAVGPGLAIHGVPGLLEDPILTIYDAENKVIATNDNWIPADAAVFVQLGAFSLTPGSKDAAIVLPLTPGAYTAVASGAGGTTGIALVEVYDASGDTGSRLVNLSARAQVGTGADILIPGLVISAGASPRRLLIRAWGPALAELVHGSLADPQLTLIDSAGAAVAFNNNWASDEPHVLTPAFIAAGAPPFSPPESKDAAVVRDIPGGLYTIQVAGVGDTSGVALVEVFDLTPEGPLSIVTLAASDSVADESGANPATFTLTRTGDTSQFIIVDYAMSGAAFNVADYAFLNGRVALAPGQTTAAITLDPVPDLNTEPLEEAALTLDPGLGYTVGATSSATVTIDNAAGTLYIASLRPETAATASTGSGTATILLNAAQTMATVGVSVTNLSSEQTTAYLRLGEPGETGAYIQSLPVGQSSGSLWFIQDTGVYSAADLVAALQTGLIYVGIETVSYPTGELRGAFVQGSGSQVFSPPADPPPAPAAPADASEAARFLTQATFGVTQAAIDDLLTKSYSQWIDVQLAKPASLHRPLTMSDFAANNAGGRAMVNGVFTRPGGVHRQSAWWQIVVNSEDQLRQRVAFALSEVFVISDENSTVNNWQEGAANYYDILVNGAFGSFRELLEDVTLSPMMGVYLSHLRNAKTNPNTGALPDENYAREIMQLFSIGLRELQPDGTLELDANGLPIPTYDQTTITETAKVFTGWAFHNDVINDTNFRRGAPDYIQPMSLYPTQHEDGTKTIVGGVVVPAGQGGVKDLEDTLDTLFNHPNSAPFFARHMIQRLVTSNPSPAYLYRVAQIFENNGAGVRGDIGAVVRAILLDYEARATVVSTNAGYGKLKEPLLRLTSLLRAFKATDSDGRYNIANPQNSLEQAALRAPSVFNFFEPDYVQPGILASAGLYAPECQILTDSTAISTPNLFYSHIFGSPAGISLDFNGMLPLVSTPDLLVDKLSLLLASGAISSSAQARIVDAFAALPASTSSTDRVRTAVHLVVNSPDAVTQR
ncbi:MAG: DUF1800 family protein [Opitutaceae bacterium]